MVSFQYAKRFFDRAPDRHESMRTNPVTGACFCPPDDSIDEQIELSRRPLAARAIFKLEVPWVPEPLPLSRFEWIALKENFDYRFIVGAYGQSLASHDYKLEAIPWFDDFAAGVLALPNIGPILVCAMPDLSRRYPPKVLPRLDWSGFYI
jgi:hypothetical protein